MGKVSQKSHQRPTIQPLKLQEREPQKEKSKNITMELKEVPEEYNHKKLRQTAEKGATIVNEHSEAVN